MPAIAEVTRERGDKLAFHTDYPKDGDYCSVLFRAKAWVT